MASIRRWQLNVPLAVRTLLVVVLGWGALHLWHERVVRINAGALVDRAREQEASDDWQGAAQSLRRYLALRPHDGSARVRLAKDFDRAATGAADQFQSLALFAAAVAAAPDDLEVRRRHLALTLQLEDYAAALEHADLLLQLQPGDPAGLKYKALALFARWNIRQETSLVEVQAAFEAANRADPADPATAARLARLYRTQSHEPKSAQLADSVMDKLVEASDGSLDSLLARHAYRKEFNLEGADADLDRALAIADSGRPIAASDGSSGRDPALFLAAGLRAMARDEVDEAENYFERAIAAAPNSPRSYLLLGQTHRKQGNPRAALEVLLRGLEKAGPTNFPLQVETAAVEIELGELDSAEKSLAAMERQADQLSGRQQTESLAMIAALRADRLLQRRDYVAAISVLKRILSLRRGGAADDHKAAANAEVQMQIGTCYSLLGLWDQAAAAHQAAADLQPRRQAVRLAAAQAWEQAGWLDEAVRQYEEALAIEAPPPQAWQALAAARFRQQAKLPREKRDWTAFQQALAGARSAMSDSAAAQLLQAEYELANEHDELAAELLAVVEPQFADVPGVAVRIAQAYERLGRPEDADRIAERLATGPAALAGALLRCELLLNRDRGDDAERALALAAEQVPAADRHALQHRQALVMLTRGKVDEARDLLERLAQDRPDDPRPQQVLAELALEGHDLARARRHEQQLQRTEKIAGQTGWRFYRAQCLIGEALQTDDHLSRQKLLDEARSLQSQLERLRPYWAPTQLLKARLAQLDARPDDETAILAYFTALRLGERRVQVYQELISLLFRQHRLAEAAGLIDRLREGDQLPGELVSLAVAADVSQGNIERAVRLAAAEVARQPDNMANHLRLGQLLAMDWPEGGSARQSQLEQAEAEFKLARELAPADLRAWSALLTFYHTTAQSARARQLLELAEGDELLSAQDKPLFLAQGYALIGDKTKAGQFYHAVVDADPEHAGVLVRAAEFFFRAEPARAEKYLRRALQIAPGDRPASRMLAALLALSGKNEQEMDEVWRLLDTRDESAAPNLADERLRAVLLLRRGGSTSREQALQLLETFVEQGDEAPVDRLLLARLYEARHQMQKAREQLDTLVHQEKPDPAHLAAYADHLLRMSDGPSADPRLLAQLLDQLAILEPEGKSFRTLGLRARWLKHERREADIASLVDAFVGQVPTGPDRRRFTQRMLLVAGLYDNLQLQSEAEACYRRAAESSPQAYRPLAVWLARHKRTAEAIELCRGPAERDESPAAAISLAAVLTLGPASADDHQATGPILAQALARHPDDAGLLLALSTLRMVQDDNDEAERLLRRVLRSEPRHVVALNNLAMLLAEQAPRRKEALALVDRAIGIAGAQAELLDTKGWIFLEQSRLAEAETSFHEALALSADSPRYRFHLALAYQRQGKNEEARRALDGAVGHKLAAESLSPREHDELRKLESQLH